MPDPTLIVAVIGVVFAGIYTIAAVASLIILHRRTPKLPEPPITPVCTTILGVDMHGHVHDLPGHSRTNLRHTA
ncbi:hypothetical protein [Qipengyuania sp. YIM B01966]|uniref:hypothetical protein n=1 Tax=Qipengyuania sp. YIM B01966 TaxID=2778646 RepID=UPI0018F74A9B|nr:hypothetical protein [Qipengyuania sp. YIM B01966]